MKEHIFGISHENVYYWRVGNDGWRWRVSCYKCFRGRRVKHLNRALQWASKHAGKCNGTHKSYVPVDNCKLVISYESNRD